MSKDVRELAFQPGEVDWASEQCGGGPHRGDSQESAHPAVRSAEQIHRMGAVIVPYAGTETSVLDKPINPSKAVLYTKRATMPA